MAAISEVPAPAALHSPIREGTEKHGQVRCENLTGNEQGIAHACLSHTQATGATTEAIKQQLSQLGDLGTVAKVCRGACLLFWVLGHCRPLLAPTARSLMRARWPVRVVVHGRVRVGGRASCRAIVGKRKTAYSCRNIVVSPFLAHRCSLIPLSAGTHAKLSRVRVTYTMVWHFRVPVSFCRGTGHPQRRAGHVRATDSAVRHQLLSFPSILLPLAIRRSLRAPASAPWTAPARSPCAGSSGTSSRSPTCASARASSARRIVSRLS